MKARREQNGQGEFGLDPDPEDFKNNGDCGLPCPKIHVLYDKIFVKIR